MSLAQLDHSVSSEELTYWMMFFKLEQEEIDRKAKTKQPSS